MTKKALTTLATLAAFCGVASNGTAQQSPPPPDLSAAGLEYVGANHNLKFLRCEYSAVVSNITDTNLTAVLIAEFDNGSQKRVYTVNGGPLKAKQQKATLKGGGNFMDLRGDITFTMKVRNKETGKEAVVMKEKFTTPPLFQVLPPSYRGMLSTARRDKNAHLQILFTPAGEKIEGIPVTVSIFDPKGKALDKKSVVAYGERMPVTLELPADAPEGVYKISSTADFGAGRVEKHETTFKIVPVRPGQVFVDQDTVLLREGKPFFPIGFYHVAQKELPEVIELGANIVQWWHWDNRPEYIEIMEKAGLLGIYETDIWGAIVGKDDGWMTNPKYPEVINAHKDKPYLAMWYVADEPSAPSDRLAKSNELFHNLDENHPTYLVCAGYNHAGLSTVADVLALDPYPQYRGNSGAPSNVSDFFDIARAGTFNRVPLIAVPQAFGNNERHRETPEHVRCFTYLSITHGARGVIWYCWKEVGDRTGAEGAGNHPETVAELKKLIAELKTLAPALMEPDAREYKSTDGAIHAMVCGSAETGRKLICVNAYPTAVDSTIIFPDIAGKNFNLKGLFGAKDAKITNGALKLKLPAMGTAAFEMQ